MVKNICNKFKVVLIVKLKICVLIVIGLVKLFNLVVVQLKNNLLVVLIGKLKICVLIVIGLVKLFNLVVVQLKNNLLVLWALFVVQLEGLKIKISWWMNAYIIIKSFSTLIYFFFSVCGVFSTGSCDPFCILFGLEDIVQIPVYASEYEAESASEYEPESDSEYEAASEAESEAEDEPEDEPESEAESESESKPEPASEPKPEPEDESEAESESESKPFLKDCDDKYIFFQNEEEKENFIMGNDPDQREWKTIQGFHGVDINYYEEADRARSRGEKFGWQDPSRGNYSRSEASCIDQDKWDIIPEDTGIDQDNWDIIPDENNPSNTSPNGSAESGPNDDPNDSSNSALKDIILVGLLHSSMKTNTNKIFQNPKNSTTDKK